jgi:hypothetical protein
VRDVVVAGRIIVRDQNLLTIDLEDILARVVKISDDIKN